MYTRNSYIPDEISTLPINYEWNNWDPFEPLNFPDKILKRDLEKISNNGITCFSYGCAEWVITRLKNHFKNDLPFYYLEAFSVYIMGVNEALPPETDHEQWEGKILGPTNLSLMTVLNTIFLSEQDPPVQNGALSAEIVNHVLPNYNLFNIWKDKIIERLIKFCNRTKENPDGKPLPVNILDPNFNYNEDEKMKLMYDNVLLIDFKKNPFLRNINKEKLILKENFD